MPALVMPFHFGIALGVARRALDEVTVQAIEKSRGPISPSLLVAQGQFQFSLGKAELELGAARALAIATLSAAWEQAATGSVPPPAMQAEVRAAASHVTEVAQRVTTVAFQSVGGSALFDTNPLQRCFRDIYAAGQHFMMSRSSIQALGQFKLHRPDANPML
ncbi:MAG TPA: acyl-CoA dehydrogenase family protein [Acetobacteraceae bacterium]|jgi:indole-3-acetate monooxygenase|nr:acyl-CoA dehydrogenase family protein [Acetobacteraceae bacterium]